MDTYETLFSRTDRLDKEKFDQLIVRLSEDKLYADIPAPIREKLFEKVRTEVCADIIQSHIDAVTPPKVRKRAGRKVANVRETPETQSE